ncbi:MAG TPA: helix-turn-helix transcriptional regulator [Bradyrhizobium sp.]|nr:helix-turn-helix transcriptional regulator [Bradyrhizobium sp.]
MQSDETDFRKLRFQSPANPDSLWIDWFCEEFSRQHYGVQTTPLGGGPLLIAGVTRMLPDLAVYRGATSLVRSVNLPELATNDDPFLMICLAGGDLNVSFRGEHAIQAPGSCFLGSPDRMGTLEAPQRTEILSIRLRRKLLEPLVPGLSDRLSRLAAPNSQALRLLLGYIESLDSEQTIAGAELSFAVTSHVHELAALIFNDGGDPRRPDAAGVRAGRLASMKDDILRRVGQNSLSVSEIARSQQISERYIRELFASEGTTFTDFVREARLAHAQRMLTDPREADRPIHAIAYESGFGDLSYFNRVFRQRYGMTPSEARNLARDGADAAL